MDKKTFEHFPSDAQCPLCKTNDDKECCLIPIDGMDKNNICEAQLIHVECIIQFSKIRYNKEFQLLYWNQN